MTTVLCCTFDNAGLNRWGRAYGSAGGKPCAIGLAWRAIEGEWDEQRTELEVLRTERPKAPAVVTGGVDLSRQMLLATACMAARIDEARLVAPYGEKNV